MHTRSGSIFYKIIVLFIFLGLLPAALVSGRLLILNRDLLETGSNSWSLPDEAIKEITSTLTNEAGIYMLYTLLVTGLTSVFISGSLIGPIKQLQHMVSSFQMGHLDESIDIKTGDEIEDVATSFVQLAQELTQTQKRLEGSISERSKELEKRAVQMQIAAQITQDTAASRELDDLLSRTVNLIRERFNFYYVSLFLIDDNHEYAVLRAATGDVGRSLLEENYRLKVGDVGIVTYVANTGSLRIVNNVDFDFVYRRESSLPLTRSEAALPLRIESNVIGVMDVQSTQVNVFNESDVASLQILADQIAVAIQNARLVSELDNRLHEINMLHQQYTRESWTRHLGGGPMTGYQYDMSQVLPIKQHLPVNQGGIVNTETFFIPGKDGNDKSALVTPLKIFEQIVGVLGVESNEIDHQWTTEEINLIEAISNQVVLALDNARLLEESQKHTEQLRLLQEITSAAASHIEVQELLNDIAGHIRSGFNLPYCGIILFDSSRKNGNVFGSSYLPDAPYQILDNVKIDLENDEIISTIIDTKEYVVVNDILHDPRMVAINELIKPLELNSMVAVPLILRGDVMGTIHLYSPRPTWVVDSDDLQLLSQISAQTANAIDISRSFEQTAKRAEHEKMITGITARMRETLDVEIVMQTAVNEVYNAFNLDAVSCYLLSNQSAESTIENDQSPGALNEADKEA